MEFNTLQDLRTSWMLGRFNYPEGITVGGVLYERKMAFGQAFEDVIIGGSKAYVVYATTTLREEANTNGLGQWIVFVWGSEANSTVRPYDVRSISPKQLSENTKVVEQVERIGDVVILKILLPSGAAALKGRVDTGAEISSLHADKFEVVNGTVRFINKEISDNIITVPLAEKQAVKSADGGVEYRPVVELDIEINGKPVRRALFNLNDRNHMDYPCLVGQNILEKTNFLIDPKINDPEAEVKEDWFDNKDFDIIGALNEEFKNLEPVLLEDDDQAEKLATLYKTLEEANITFHDLVRYIRTDARKVMEDVGY